MLRDTARLEVGTLVRMAIAVVTALVGTLGVTAVLLYPVLQALQGGS